MGITLHIYIGELPKGGVIEEFGGPPPRLTEDFPPHHNGMWSGRDYMTGEKQTDWGSWAGVTTKAQILRLISDLYDQHRSYTDPSHMPHLYKRLVKLRASVDTLFNDERYALVLIET